MKIVHFPKETFYEEWLQWRKSGIGATDISVILGSSPYLTPLQLWEIKCGFREHNPINRAIEHGIANEPLARNWLNEHHQWNLNPLYIEDSEQSFMRASLDGYDGDHQILTEIKCPVSESTIEKAKEQQAIPLHWRQQMQWQMMLTRPKRAILAVWDYRVKRCYPVEMFSDENLQAKMREVATDFWRMVRIGKPPRASDKDYIEIEDEDLKNYLKEYQQLTEGEKILADRKKELKTLIGRYGNEGNFKAYGFTITKCMPRVSYDIEKMKFDGIDVDLYAKPSQSSGYYVIKGPRA